MQWTTLGTAKVGQYGEYAMKMALARLGCEIYVPEIDDHGVDLLFRRAGSPFGEVQVKSATSLNYRFVTKEKFAPRERFFYGLVLLLSDEEPECFLIPSLAWNAGKLHPLLKSRDYIGGKSKPEFGIDLARNNALELLDEFRLTDATLSAWLTSSETAR